MDSLFEEIESGAIYFDLMLASTADAFVRRMARLPKIKAAMTEMLLHPDLACSYLERAEELFYRPADAGYLNSNDTAIAAYIFMVARSPDPDIQHFIRMVAACARPELRWAPLLAQRFAGRVAGISVGQSRDVSVGNLLFTPASSVALQTPVTGRGSVTTGSTGLSVGGH